MKKGSLGVFLLLCMLMWSRTVCADIFINELMSRNGDSIVDTDGSTSDWLELYNSGSSAVNLDVFYLTDDENELTKWRLPNVTLGANDYLVIFCSGKEHSVAGEELHANFSLSSSGGFIGLVYSDGIRIIDQFDYPELGNNNSYGRTVDGLGIFTAVTPDSANSTTSFTHQLESPSFSHKSGYYEKSFSLALTANSVATIRYTTNGSDPTTSNSYIYTTPLTVTSTTVVRARAFSNNAIASPSVTAIFLFLNNTKTQSATPPTGWPANDAINGQNMDYAMDSTIVNDSTYSKQMDYAFKDIDTLSIVTDLANLFDQSTGIYVNAGQKGELWERPASIELIGKDGDFQINGGIRMRGGYSRNANNPKHAFRLFFGNSYEGGPLNHSIFENEGTDKFKKLDLRTAQNYSWQYGVNSSRRLQNTIMQDVYSRDLQRDMGQPYTKSRYYHLFLNGLYWGIYQTQERANQNFAESYFGGIKEDYDCVKSTGSTGGYDLEATYGTLDAANRLWTLASTGFANDVDYFKAQGMNLDGSRNSNYERLLDVDSVIDYMIILIYCNNWDMAIGGGVNNLFALYNKTSPDGFKWFCHDFEHSFQRGANNDITGTNPSSAQHDFNPFYLHNRLLTNANYKQRFADRLYNTCYNNGPLTITNALKRYSDRGEQLQYAIIAESARWGDYRDTPGHTKVTWENAVNNLKNNYFSLRTPIMLQQMYNRGWLPSAYNSSTSFGNPVTLYNYLDVIETNEVEANSNYNLRIDNNGIGEIKYTTNGEDPRTVTGGINTNTISSSSEVNLTISTTTTVTARVYNNGVWSALRRINVKVFNNLSALQITEINPYPKAGLPEFMEIYNNSDEPLNLSLCKFTKAVSLEFAPGTVVQPKSYVIVTNDAGSFNNTYGFQPTATYTGTLSDEGERVKLKDALGNTIFDFEYDNTSIKNLPARGNNFSLIRPIDATEMNPSHINYWTISETEKGSPGLANGETFTEPLTINEIANADANAWVEIKNSSDELTSFSGWFLTDDPLNLSKYSMGFVNISPYLTINQTTFGSALSLNAYGGHLYLVSPNKRYVHGFKYSALLAGESWTTKVDKFSNETLTKSSSTTPDADNQLTAAGPVVISEIMYSHSEIVDFMEITNISDSEVKFYDEQHPTNLWRVAGINFTFPSGRSIASQETIVLINNKESIETFRATHQLAPSIQIFSFDGKISGDGERIAIEKPTSTSTITNVGSYTPFTIVDEVEYSPNLPWPTQAARSDYSLERISLSSDGNSAENWQASSYKDGSPGTTSTVYRLEVTNGTGSGNYPAGTVVNIQAVAPFLNLTFTNWTGATFANPTSATTTVTMGTNDLSVIANYSYQQSGTAGSIVINEFMAENNAFYMENDNHNFVDWIELKNRTNVAINIGGFYLSTDFNNPQMWRVPNNTIINANDTLILWCDKLNSGLHTSFSIKKKEGNELLIFDTVGDVVDSIVYPQQYSNISYGRNGELWGYFSTASLDNNNLTSKWMTEAVFAEMPTASVEAGFYDAAQTVELSVADGGIIRYTTDGSIPTDESLIYSQPIVVSSSTVIRAINLKSGHLQSTTMTASYLISEDPKLPVMSISVSEDHMYNPKTGFYVQGDGTNGTGGYGSGYTCNYKRPWRRPANIEFIEPDGARAFTSTGEIKVYGGWSRDGVIKSLGFYAEDTVKYPMFGYGDVDEFDSIVMRGGGNDWSGTKLDDAVGQKCIDGYLDLDMQRSRPTLVYINGKFWATMNIREKLNEDYIKNRHGYDDDEVDLLDTPTSANSGDTVAYRELLTYTANNDVSLPSNFEYLETLVDMKELGHYWMAESYTGNGDWCNTSGTRFNNIKWWQGKDSKGRWRWMLYDMDGGFRGSGGGGNKYDEGMLGTFPFLRDGLKNPDYREWYIQRATAMTNILYDGDRVESIVNEFRSTLGSEMQRHIDRWRRYGNADRDVATDKPWWQNPAHQYYIQQHNGYNFESGGHLGVTSDNYNNWYNMCNSLIQFGHGRQSVYLGQLQSYFGLGNLKAVRVIVDQADGGTVEVNGVKSEMNDFTGNYFQNIPIKLKAKANKGYVFAGWINSSSAFTTATIFPKNSSWRYYDYATAPPSDWNSTSFNDSSWATGNGSFGYGDAHTTTVKQSDNGTRVNTTYYRKDFNIDNPAEIVDLNINLRRDDGAVVYLNGTEVARSNMPVGTITHTSWASSAVGGGSETAYFNLNIDKNLLVTGENILAVQVHQIHNTSSDVSFDAELISTVSQTESDYKIYDNKIELPVDENMTVTALFKEIPPVVINEVSYQPTSGSAYQFIELYNHEDIAVDLSNWSLDGVSFTFTPGTFISPREAILIVPDSSRWNEFSGQVYQWQGATLQNSGTIKLLDADNVVISEMSYDSPSLEQGATLALKDPEASTVDVDSWRQSWYIGGTPGKANDELHPITLNELYYNAPSSQGSDSDFEFIELYHRGDFRLDISDYEFKDGIDYKFENESFIMPGEYIVIAKNKTTYALNGYQVFEWKDGSLSNSGELLRLEDADGKKVFSATYDVERPWPTLANGEGYSLAWKDLTKNDYDMPENWSIENQLHGSPGEENDCFVATGQIVINEILTHTDWPQVDFVELHNPTDNPVDLSGWFLTDELNDSSFYTIPAGTTIAPGGYLTIYEDNDADPANSMPAEYFGSVFSLSSYGEQVYVISPDRKYSHGFKFGASENGVTFGRYMNSEGRELFPVMSSITANAKNSAPKVGDIIFSEIMYNPATNDVEFLELKNRSQNNIKLYDEQYSENCWQVSGIGFTFPTNTELEPGETLILIESSISIEDFRANYEVDANVQIFQYTSSLSNDGEKIAILRPDKPDTLPDQSTYVPYLTVEQLTYNDKAPWPYECDGQGYSLVRKYPVIYADDAGAWISSTIKGGSPGFEQLVTLTVTNGTGSGTYNEGTSVAISADSITDANFAQWDDLQGVVGNKTIANTTINLAYSNVTVKAFYEAIIDWSPQTQLTYGDKVTTDNQLNASSQIAGTFSYNLNNDTLLAAGDHNLTCSFTVTDTSMFVDSSPITHTITVATKELVCSADHKQAREGSAIPELTYTLSGFVENESENVISGAPNLSTSANINTVGLYPITISTGTLTADSYNFTMRDSDIFIFEAGRPDSITITLQPGWNLISSPFNDTKLSEIFDTSYIISDMFDWDGYYKIKNCSDLLEPETGYWIFAFSEQTATISGTYEPKNEDIMRKNAWNLIGVVEEREAKELTWGWDSNSQIYQIYSTLKPAEGYWIYKD